jgi:hypothetical protein
MPVQQVPVLDAASLDENLDIARVVENWKLVLGNVRGAASVRAVVPLAARGGMRARGGRGPRGHHGRGPTDGERGGGGGRVVVVLVAVGLGDHED